MNWIRKIFLITLLFGAVASWMIAPQFTIVRVSCCCSQQDQIPEDGCPCDADQHRCCPCAAVMRAGVICEKITRLSLFADEVREEHGFEQEKALQRHDSPPLPPPKRSIA